MPGVTLKEIAERAGCSITVVSKTLNSTRGTAAVGMEMRARVESIARDLGYTPNYHARSLQRQRSNTLGLVCSFRPGSHFDNDYWGRLIQGVEQRTRAANHDLLIVGPTAELSEVDRGIQHLQQGRVDALVVPAPVYHDRLEQFNRVDLPVVLAASAAPGCHPGIAADMEPGIRQAMEHFAALGHRELLWVPQFHGRIDRDSLRSQIVMMAAREYGIRVATMPIQIDPITADGPVESLVEHCRGQFAAALRRSQPPTAILAYHERIGMGICQALSDAGLDVPRDVSIIGFDDIYAHVTTPAMTVVSICLCELGERAAELALQISREPDPANPGGRGYFESLPSYLVVRKSTAIARRGK